MYLSCVCLSKTWLNIKTDEMGMVFFLVTASIPWVFPCHVDLTLVVYFIEVSMNVLFLEEFDKRMDYCIHPHMK